MKTNRTITMQFRDNGEITIPAGTRVKAAERYTLDDGPEFFVDDLSWLDRNSIIHHDATYYGIRVKASDVTD